MPDMNQAASPLAPIVIDDKRLSTRRPLFCKAQIAAGGESIGARTLDIGTGGVALMMEINAPIGQVYVLQLKLPGTGSTMQQLNSQIQVLHSVLTKTGFRVGCRFVAPDMQTRDMLKQFMKS
jgi:hypothetical protein